MSIARVTSTATLIAQLPPAQGTLIANAPIGKQTWFGVGGPAEVLFRPASAADLAAFLAALSPEIPVTVIGVGSNILVRDGGILGLTIRLGRGGARLTIAADEIRVGAAALDRIVAFTAADAGLAGLEFLSGIPGTIGGSVRMNAGAYGREIKDVLVSATALDRYGETHTVERDAMGLSYRYSAVDPSWIFIEARLRGCPGDRTAIAASLAEIRATREATQPVRARTGGSTFKNPPGESAWRLIDAAGCRGLVRGGAMVSQTHANFLINTGGATAADIEGLGEDVRRRVFEASGIMLEWEIERIGQPSEGMEHTEPPPPRKLGQGKIETALLPPSLAVASHPFTLSPRRPGREGRVRGADEAVSGAAHLTLPRLRRGPLPLPPEGRRGALCAKHRGQGAT